MTCVVQRTASAHRCSPAGAAAAALVALVAVLGLHVVRADLEPASHRLSEYAVGSWGWLMTAVFALVAVAVWSLRRALPLDTRRSPVRALLATAAAGFAMAGIVPTDPSRPDAVRETVHTVASGGALMALTAAALWTVTIGAGAIGWQRARGPARVAATVGALAVLSGPLVHDGPWTGAVQRLACAALGVWLLLACLAVGRGGPSPVPGDVRRGDV